MEICQSPGSNFSPAFRPEVSERLVYSEGSLRVSHAWKLKSHSAFLWRSVTPNSFQIRHSDLGSEFRWIAIRENVNFFIFFWNCLLIRIWESHIRRVSGVDYWYSVLICAIMEYRRRKWIRKDSLEESLGSQLLDWCTVLKMKRFGHLFRNEERNSHDWKLLLTNPRGNRSTTGDNQSLRRFVVNSGSQLNPCLDTTEQTLRLTEKPFGWCNGGIRLTQIFQSTRRTFDRCNKGFRSICRSQLSRSVCPSPSKRIRLDERFPSLNITFLSWECIF